MAEKRKDSKGRVLHKGESQRKDKTYQYRFQDASGKRVTVYAPTLQELRKKEDEINKRQLLSGDYSKGQISIIEMIRRYLYLNKSIRPSTRENYETGLNVFSTDPFAERKIGEIKKSDIKVWAIQRYEMGLSYSMIDKILGIMKPALEMAVDEDILAKNPSRFKLSDLIPRKTVAREALTAEQQEKLLDFVKNDSYCKWHYDCVVVLLGTGMRISEFCGLTLDDIDFDNRRISINHQLCRTSHGEYYIEKPKTENGTRYVPMTDDVFRSLKNIIESRKRLKVEYVIDGYHGFIVIGQTGKPQTYRNYDHNFLTIRKRFSEANPGYYMPKVTPHVLRHTFCTNMVNAGVGIKSLQYLMGHATVNLTLNLYSHNSYEQASTEMLRAMK